MTSADPWWVRDGRFEHLRQQVALVKSNGRSLDHRDSLGGIFDLFEISGFEEAQPAHQECAQHGQTFDKAAEADYFYLMQII